jgi:hypothetical protein
MIRNFVIRIFVIACLFSLLAGSAVRGQDKYYAVVFGYQDRNNRCCEAHSFATFVRIRQQATGPETVDQATISWLPARGIVKLFKGAERGINHSLKESLDSVKPGHAIAQWGPFEIKEELFHRAKKQAHFLSSGAILYKAVEPFARPAGVAVNCEHAICDIALNPGEAHLRTGQLAASPGVRVSLIFAVFSRVTADLHGQSTHQSTSSTTNATGGLHEIGGVGAERGHLFGRWRSPRRQLKQHRRRAPSAPTPGPA